MSTLILIGLVGGLITGVSPCVLPMLPIIFFAGSTTAERSEGRPVRVIAGIVVSFSLIALTGSILLSALGLPDGLLRWVGLVVLTLVGLGLIIPAIGHLIERPFSRLPKITGGKDRGAFVLGLGLGTLYVPCAGPVLTAITVAGATGNVGWDIIVLTVSSPWAPPYRCSSSRRPARGSPSASSCTVATRAASVPPAASS